MGFVFLWMGVSEALDAYAWATDGIVATGIIVAHGEGNIIGEFTEVEVATESGETVRVMLGGTVGSVGQAVELTYLPDVDYLPDVKEARPGDWTDDSWLYYLPLVLFAGVAFMVMTVLYRKARVIDAGGDRKEH